MVAPFVERQWDESALENDGISNFNRRATMRGSIIRKENELATDITRKKAFANNKEFLNMNRNLEHKVYSGTTSTICKSTRKADIILSDNIIETLLRRGEDMVNSFDLGSAKSPVDFKKLQLSEKLEKFRNILLELKSTDGNAFSEYLEIFEASKRYYEDVMKESLMKKGV